MKVSTFLVEFLKEKGIDTIFELQGGMITRLIDEIHRAGGIKIVSMHHEQSAAFAADAYARVTNKPGFALATSGPGATNLLTGIGCCYFDSVPAIFITGQVNTDEQKGEKPTRQIGFQETDIVSVARPITKAAYAVKSAKDIPQILNEAYRICLEGRPGPVLIDIPMNVQNKEINEKEITKSIHALSKWETSETLLFLKEFRSELKKSKRPLCLAGRGVRASGTVNEMKNFIEVHNLPVVCSLLGLDSIPYYHPNRIGFIGTYGNRWANYALANCDLLLVLGSRLDLRQTGADILSFQKGKKIFHVDIDPAELNNSLSDCITLNTDLVDFFQSADNIQNIIKRQVKWFAEIKSKYELLPDTKELKNITGINPNIAIHKLSEYSVLAKAFIADVGNNQMWTAQSLELNEGQLFLTSGGMGSMGYSLPAAIGVSISLGNAPVVSISGDGGFQINMQELQTIVRNNLPVKIVILNNQCLGMIRQFQDSYFESCYQSTVWGYSAPDFSKISKAYGIDSLTVNENYEIESGLRQMWADPLKPFLLNLNIDIFTNAYPKLAFGKPLSQMEPEN